MKESSNSLLICRTREEILREWCINIGKDDFFVVEPKFVLFIFIFHPLETRLVLKSYFKKNENFLDLIFGQFLDDHNFVRNIIYVSSFKH